MISVIQRVSHAHVDISGQRVAQIGTGIMALVGVEPEDNHAIMRRLTNRILAYRIFPDDQGRMNRSLRDIDGDLLLVPQFTLLADTTKGNRPSFSGAATPALGEELFDAMVAYAKQIHGEVGAGQFGADMQVGLVNDGPVTLELRAR